MTAKKKSGAARKAAANKQPNGTAPPPTASSSKPASSPSSKQDPIDLTQDSDDDPVQIDDQPETAELWKDKGTEAYKAKRYAEAIQLYTKAMSLDPTLSAAQFNRAAAYMALRRYSEALEDVRAVLASQKSDRQAKTLARLGKIQLAMAQIQPAVSSLEEARSIASSSHDAATLKNIDADLSKITRLQGHLASLDREKERGSWGMMIFALDAAQREVEETPLQWKLWRLEALVGRKMFDDAISLAT